MVEPVKKYPNCHVMREARRAAVCLSACHPNFDAFNQAVIPLNTHHMQPLHGTHDCLYRNRLHAASQPLALHIPRLNMAFQESKRASASLHAQSIA